MTTGDIELVRTQLRNAVTEAVAAQALYDSQFPAEGTPTNPTVGVVDAPTPQILESEMSKRPGGTRYLLTPEVDYGDVLLRKKQESASSYLQNKLTVPFGWSKVRTFPMPILGNMNCEEGANDWTIVGCRSHIPAGLPTGRWNVGTTQETRLSQLPRNIYFDRVHLKCDPTKGGTRGIGANGINNKIVNSVIDDVWNQGAGKDSQAIGWWSGPGPTWVENCYLSASGENFLVGGSGKPLPYGFQHRDLVFIRNHCFKPKSWKPIYKVVGPNPDVNTMKDLELVSGYRYATKNLFEIKALHGGRIERNILQNCWVDAQSGHGVLITARESDIRNVLFRHNIMLDVEYFAMALLSQNDGEMPFEVSKSSGLDIYDNLFWNCFSGIQINKGYNVLRVKRNTFVGTAFNGGLAIGLSGSMKDDVVAPTDLLNDFEYTENITNTGKYFINAPGVVGFKALKPWLGVRANVSGNIFGHMNSEYVERDIPQNTVVEDVMSLLNADGSLKDPTMNVGADIAALKSFYPWFRWWT